MEMLQHIFKFLNICISIIRAFLHDVPVTMIEDNNSRVFPSPLLDISMDLYMPCHSEVGNGRDYPLTFQALVWLLASTCIYNSICHKNQVGWHLLCWKYLRYTHIDSQICESHSQWSQYPKLPLMCYVRVQTLTQSTIIKTFYHPYEFLDTNHMIDKLYQVGQSSPLSSH